MRLAGQIRRSLTPAETRGETLDRLRRELARMSSQGALGRSPGEAPSLARVQLRTPTLPREPPPRSSAAGLPELPEALDPQGQLYRHDFAPRFRLGQAALERPGAGLLSLIERLLQLAASWRPERDGPLRAEDLLFLDLETTGLSRSAETIPFLIGAGCWPAPGEEAGPGGFRVDQIFLRDPADEALALDRLQQLLDRTRAIVTFNGRGFDLPLLRNRCLLTRTFLDLDHRPHLDLLPLCRRLFRSRLTNCRLVTLERELLGFERQDDVPGSEAPRIYNEWLRTGQVGELPLILEHNRLDVASMAPLLHRVSQHLLDPLRWAEDAEELLGGAQWLLRALGPQGLSQLGETCLVRGLELARRPGTRRSLLVTLARHLRRTGRVDEASVRWEQFRREFPDHSTGWVELAKYHEHVTRDVGRALELAERCPHQQTDEMQLRLRRLRRRVQRTLDARRR